MWSLTKLATAIYLFFLLLHRGVCWHIYDHPRRYNKSTACEIISNTPENKKIRLWYIQHNTVINTNDQVFGFNYAIQKLWDHQHPKDCSKAKFMISSGWEWGFGSVVHVEAALFSLAMSLGRVYLSHPGGPIATKNGDNRWQVRTTFCRNRKVFTLDCYYEPWSSCTIEDVIGSSSNATYNITLKDIPRYSDKDFYLLGDSPFQFSYPIETDTLKSFIIDHSGLSNISRLLPPQLQHVISCSDITSSKLYYWWRAISATYYLRPNPPTVAYMKQLQTLPLLPNMTCVGIYVRHGDKSVEMKLLPFSVYAESALEIWHHGMLHPKLVNRNNSTTGTIMLGTEDPAVIREANQWAKTTGWTVLYTSLFDRSKVTARMSWNSKILFRKRSSEIHHDLEYISMLLNLEYSLQCDAWVCTLASNWCRLIDELRATIGNKASNVFVDLSNESCAHPPCIGNKNVQAFGWRR